MLALGGDPGERSVALVVHVLVEVAVTLVVAPLDLQLALEVIEAEPADPAGGGGLDPGAEVVGDASLDTCVGLFQRCGFGLLSLRHAVRVPKVCIVVSP